MPDLRQEKQSVRKRWGYIRGSYQFWTQPLALPLLFHLPQTQILKITQKSQKYRNLNQGINRKEKVRVLENDSHSKTLTPTLKTIITTFKTLMTTFISFIFPSFPLPLFIAIFPLFPATLPIPTPRCLNLRLLLASQISCKFIRLVFTVCIVRKFALFYSTLSLQNNLFYSKPQFSV